jgi:type II secretory pathway component GspD/PulD (secretin)
LINAAVVASTSQVAQATLNPIGGGINYFLKSDKLNLAAVIQAAKSDSKTKVLASPILMTVDNKEATIEATDMIYLFSGYQYAGNTYSGSAVRNYEKRDIGLTVKVTPKINPNGTVMLTIEETFETQGADQVVVDENGPTPYATVTTRKMSSDVSVENRQTIVMGGLTKKSSVESESGIPILKDIPWIGKWLFGSVTQKEGRSELLVFITPYVLDDAESSQSEAFRRKKALSDPRPWDDNGWSASPLADPVSRKEQLRRFKDEWKKQDEERQTKLAIEKAKVERAKKLEKMSEEERKAWIEIHKDELDKEAREAFEKQVEEQKDLKEFVETLKKQDLEKAEKKLEESKKE